MPNKEWCLVTRKHTNPEVEGTIDLTARTVAFLKFHEHSGVQPPRISVIRQTLSLEVCSPPCRDDARKNVSGYPTTCWFPG